MRFPDGSRRKVERVTRADAERDLAELLALRAEERLPEHRRMRPATFNQVIDAWFEAGCPNATPSSRSRHVRVKSPNTVTTAGHLLDHQVRPRIGALAVERTATDRLEDLFRDMAASGYATSTINRTWLYLNQACQLAVRQRRTRSNPAADVLLPPARPAKARRALTIDQARRLLADAIPSDAQPAMWLTGLMCGLRPGELAGLRWPYVVLEGDLPTLEVAERALEINDRYAGQVAPKTERGRRRLDLHPLLVAALTRHRDEQRLLGLHDPEGFVFCTRNGTPQTLSNLRRALPPTVRPGGAG